MALMSEDRVMSGSRDPDPVRRDRKSEECFQPLAEIITGELLAGGSLGDRVATTDGARGVGELIAASVLDRFVVRPRPAERVHDHVSRGAPADAGVILEVRDMSVAYGTKTAVDGISLQMTRGEIFGLLGPNGAGKTSTLSAIEGLIKPRSGAVFLDGVDIRRHPSQAKAKLGVQLQATSFQSQLTIKQIVRLYAGLYGLRLSDPEITAGLQEIGLEGEANKPFKQLSGGQQQRLSLYVAVVHEPALLLLDEPTLGLDPQSRRQL
jgi:ABC-type branched-subunit amino acid transport system ATPase component